MHEDKKEYACELGVLKDHFATVKFSKVKTLVISLLISPLIQLSLLSEARYFNFGWLRLQMSTSKNIIAKNVKGNKTSNLTTVSEMTK